MKIKQLLLPSDVVRTSEVGKKYPACDIASCKEIEEHNFNNHLGYEFYQLLLADLSDLSSATKWNTTTNYTINQIVTHEGKYYTATTAHINSQPPTIANWKITPKFQNPCYESFWCEYLCRFLSMCVNDWEYRNNPEKEERDYPLSEGQMRQKTSALNQSANTVLNNMKKAVARVRKDKLHTCYAAFEKFGVIEKEENCGCDGEVKNVNSGYYMPFGFF